MKIIFLCGFLEPGKCGVGDYTRRMASELIRVGHPSLIVSLNDKFIEREFTGFQYSEEISVPVFRLPSSIPAFERFRRAKTIIDKFNPDWLSLQFVLFAFNEKGLPFGLTNLMSFIGASRRWHIMFHELWLGMEKEANLKFKLWGMLQRVIIRKITKELKPEVVHTQCVLHKLNLEKIKIRAEILPLISNIPAIHPQIKEKAVKSRKVISFVIFGSIYEGTPMEEFAREAGSFASKHEIDLRLLLIGRNRAALSNWIKVARAVNLDVQLLGELPFKEISEIFYNSSYGISTTPFLLSEKSGSVMAMLEHGLPVLCVARPYSIRQRVTIKPLPGITEYVGGTLEGYLMQERDKREIFSNTVSNVSINLIKCLSTEKIKKETSLVVYK
jgi:glycosyltransferase involved in cell wall biosynthesis